MGSEESKEHEWKNRYRLDAKGELYHIFERNQSKHFSIRLFAGVRPLAPVKEFNLFPADRQKP